MIRPGEAQDWRRRAEEALEAEEGANLEGLDLRRLVHELRVHQVELELQNHALEEARLEAEAGWERYQELYDFAPTAFFTVDAQGAILEVNLAGARLLEVDRSLATHQPLARFLEPPDRGAFEAFLHRALEPGGSPPGRVTLARRSPQPGIPVRLEGTPSADGKVLQLAILEISALDAPGKPPEPRSDLGSQLRRLTEDRLALHHLIAQELEPSLVRLEGLCIPLGDGELAPAIRAAVARLGQAVGALQGLARGNR